MTGMTTPAGQVQEDDVISDDPELVEDDVLVEEISIDGMCGVY
jgi:mycofactocin precursor